MPAFEWVHVQLHQQKGMISLSPPTICNSAGFISIERFQSLATEGKMLSLSWWENEYAVLQWKNHVLHAKAQQEGRESIFDFYKISIAHITREYSFKKDKDNV
ncbi:TPA: antibiotic biosynthesis monooxygenase [Escherichia coli]|nr:antibiotic biosynthesis monooxygenase [Escherichia coli]HBC1042230.1 antibiotic biosynthesis monooxygenase [Escherichia coli]